MPTRSLYIPDNTPQESGSNALTRRHFIQIASAASLSALTTSSAGAIETINRAGGPRLRLSIAAYSFRSYFIDSINTPTNEAGRQLDMQAFVDYCADQGCEGAELTSYFFPKEVTTSQLRAIQRHAFLRGVTVSGSAIGNNFARVKGPELDDEIAHAKHWIDNAVVLGAPHIRVMSGSAPNDATLNEVKRNCIEALEECCAYAGERGIFLGLENHPGMVAEPDDLLSVVKAVKSPWFGVSLDTGNFQTVDPYADLARCAPYAVNVQLKVEMRRAGAAMNEPADFPRIAKILRDANYQGWVALEYEAEKDPWQAVPAALAQLKPLFQIAT